MLRYNCARELKYGRIDMIRKLISFITLIALLSMSLTTSFAASDVKTPIKIVVDNSNIRVAESQEGSTITRASFNKKTKQLDVQIIDSSTKKIIRNAQIKASPTDITATVDGEKVLSLSASSGTYTERTIMNYEYKIYYDTDKWTLWKPKGSSLISQYSKTVYEKSTNRSNLNYFKDWVDEIDYTEKELAGFVTASAITWIAGIIITAISTGVGAATLLTAAGVTGKTYLVSLDLEKACKKAEYYYGRCK